MAPTRPRLLDWQFAGVAAVAVFVFFLTLFGLARYVDQTALEREKTQLRSALDVEIREIARRIAPIADWDDAVLHLDRSFDAAWGIKNIGEYFVQNDSLSLSYVLDPNDRVVLATRDGRVVGLTAYGPLARAAAALVVNVRKQEQRRGILRPPFHAPGTITWPIQAASIEGVGHTPFVVVASLVQ